jgi:hypothetical protein
MILSHSILIVENSHIHTMRLQKHSDLGQVNTFFTSTEEGGWEDLSASGCKCLSTIKSYSSGVSSLLIQRC